MGKIAGKFLKITFVRLFMAFLLVLGVSFFMYGGCGSDGETCFFVDGLDLGLADDTSDCISSAEDFNCVDFLFDPATDQCDGIDCEVCEDGGCDLAFETANDVDCDGLQFQFDCDESIFAEGICALGDCNFCEP